MTDLEIAEQKALFVLLLESRIRPSTYFPVVRTLEEYHAAIPRDLSEVAFEPWFRNGWAKKYREGPTVCAKLKQEAYGDAYKTVLTFLNGTSLSVHPDQREIVTDARCSDGTPLREGWKWLQYERDEPMPPVNPSPILAAPERAQTPSFHLDRWAAIATIVGIPLAVTLWWFS